VGIRVDKTSPEVAHATRAETSFNNAIGRVKKCKMHTHTRSTIIAGKCVPRAAFEGPRIFLVFFVFLVLPFAATAVAALVYVFGDDDGDNLASLNLTPHRVRACGEVENSVVAADVCPPPYCQEINEIFSVE